MADKMQALLGGNPMIKSVLSNPKQMKMAQEMLRNPEMQKQIGGVISNPTVIAKASEVLSGLQQMNTVQAGGRKRFRRKKSRRRKGGNTGIMEKIGWTKANKEDASFDINKSEHKARLFARIYKWYRDSNENGVPEDEIAKHGEEIKKAIFWNENAVSMDDTKLEKMRTNNPKINILKQGWTLQDIAYAESGSFTAINIGEDGAKRSMRNVPPMSWPPEINPLYIKIGDTYTLLELDNISGLGPGIRYYGRKVILDPNNTSKSSGYGKSKYKYRYKKTGHQTEKARNMGKKSTNKVARGKPCERAKMMGSMCEPGYECDDLHLTHTRSKNGPFLPVCFSKTLMKGGKRKSRRKKRRKSKKRKSRRKKRRKSRRRRKRGKGWGNFKNRIGESGSLGENQPCVRQAVVSQCKPGYICQGGKCVDKKKSKFFYRTGKVMSSINPLRASSYTTSFGGKRKKTRRRRRR